MNTWLIGLDRLWSVDRRLNLFSFSFPLSSLGRRSHDRTNGVLSVFFYLLTKSNARAGLLAPPPDLLSAWDDGESDDDAAAATRPGAEFEETQKQDAY